MNHGHIQRVGPQKQHAEPEETCMKLPQSEPFTPTPERVKQIKTDKRQISGCLGLGEEQREGSDHKGRVGGWIRIGRISCVLIAWMGVNISLNGPALAGDVTQLVEHLPST